MRLEPQAILFSYLVAIDIINLRYYALSKVLLKHANYLIRYFTTQGLHEINHLFFSFAKCCIGVLVIY